MRIDSMYLIIYSIRVNNENNLRNIPAMHMEFSCAQLQLIRIVIIHLYGVYKDMHVTQAFKLKLRIHGQYFSGDGNAMVVKSLHCRREREIACVSCSATATQSCAQLLPKFQII